MDNLRAVIKNLFCYVAPKEILDGQIQYDSINEDTFLQLGSGYITKYSNDELKNMYYFLENEFQWLNWKQKGETPIVENQGKGRLNVFDALVAFDYAVLIEENGSPLCQYTQLLRWRDMITVLDEDLFITSFFAFKDSMAGRRRQNFYWKPVIGHNNRALNCLVAKGVAENHFHLKGSAPQFHLSWISLMNQIDRKDFDDQFEEYEKNRLQKNLSINANYSVSKLSDMWKQAVLIRLFLFSILQKDCLEWGDAYVPVSVVLDVVTDNKLRTELKRKFSGNEKIRLEDYAESLGGSMFALKRWYSEEMVKRLLNDIVELKDNLGIIQNNINYFHEKYGRRDLDYMICENWLAGNGKKDTNGPLSGERWFLYQIFSAVNRREKSLMPYINWFYLYLVLKSGIRRELVQANSNVGFDNFLKYQDRKDVFVEDDKYKHIYIRMAVRDTIYNQHIKTLEARIVPKKDWKSSLKTIREYDQWITENVEGEEKEQLLDTFFYVFHFVKESERIVHKLPCLEECRHYMKRREVRQQAQAIAALRESGTMEATRVKGIDACSPEIWCRPEVFAQAFRFLKNHSVVEDDALRCGTLFATYHVGEDFLDVIDGLRAIDEAISFLDLRCGDRLGHALALGIDIDDWYERKSYKILINKMGYLDNLVWLYAKLRKYCIEGCDEVRAYIEKRFHEYFAEIYENNMVKDTIQHVFQNAKDYFDQRETKHNYNHENLIFGINEYYDAWKLRGDDPELYRDGFFKLRGGRTEEWEYYAINMEFPQNYKIRYNPETALLYYMYHFNPNVKVVGDQMVEVRVSHEMVDAIKKVRNVMQREISKMGIGIETNPSSNYLIGTFRRYDMHPITRWYNMNLVFDQKELEQCPQMQVSINTDDQGVFSTYIENEYAYLALALEKSKDEKGDFIYNRTMILRWLENVRQMGIDQSFYQREH